jgi:MFS family permease
MDSAGSKAAIEWRNFWFLPVAAALGYSIGVLHTYSIGPFIEPLTREFGWTRAQISMGITIAGIGTAIFGVPIGMLVDRLGPRIVGLIGAVTMSSGVAFLSTASGTTANWVFLWSLVALGSLCVHATVWTAAVATRFEASRGLAFAVTLSGASIGATVFPVLATWLIGNYGWRTAFVAMSLGWAAVVFPLLLIFFRGANDGTRQARAAAAKAAGILPGVSFAEGIRSVAFYKLLLAGGFFAFTAIGITVHFVPILRDSGAEPLAAAGIASLIGIFSIIGRLGTGFLLDRFPGHIVGAGCFLFPIIAAGLLLFDGANPLSQSLAAAFFGLTVGAEIDVIAYLMTRQFGLKSFGSLFGAIVTALSLGVAFGPLAAGAAYDRYDSYGPFLVLNMILMAISCIALATLGKARFAAHGPAPEAAEA